jgi:DNA-binding transcriptional ArsR family regulator
MAERISPYKAIADDTRRDILDLLRQDNLTAGAIAGVIAQRSRRVSRPAVSKHLSILRRSRLVVAHKRGREHIYSLNAEPLHEVQNWINQYQTHWGTKLQALKDFVESHPITEADDGEH